MTRVYRSRYSRGWGCGRGDFALEGFSTQTFTCLMKTFICPHPSENSLPPNAIFLNKQALGFVVFLFCILGNFVYQSLTLQLSHRGGVLMKTLHCNFEARFPHFAGTLGITAQIWKERQGCWVSVELSCLLLCSHP